MENNKMEYAPLVLCLIFSILILCLHWIYLFTNWQTTIGNKLMEIAIHTGLFSYFFKPHLIALAAGSLYALGRRGMKSETAKLGPTITKLGLGLLLYFGAYTSLFLPAIWGVGIYTLALIIGYLLVISALIYIRRIIYDNLLNDQFNKQNRRFPQERKRIANSHSVNIKTDAGWLNIINPFRATMVLGTPGSGKSYTIVESFIQQHLQKGMSMLIYDFKYPDLSKVAYNYFLKYRTVYPIPPAIYIINFSDPQQSHRVNLIAPNLIQTQADALATSEALFLNLNKEYIKKKDFFTSSAVNLVAAIIWFLRNFENGKYCHIPMVILFMNLSDQVLFMVLEKRADIKALLSPFADALSKQAFEQLAGQTASARIPLSRLATKELFWVLSSNDFNLAINAPEKPAILLLANNPKTQKSYGAIFGLLSSALVRVVNEKKRLPLSMIIDELPTIYIHGLDNLIATARSNKISTLLSFQDLAQLERDYGRDVANTIFNTVGNKITGAVVSETAKKISDMIGKVVQQRANISYSKHGTSMGKTTTLDYLIPPETIAQLSQGEFCGVVADTFKQKMTQKIFHAKLKVDKKDLTTYPIPSLSKLTKGAFAQKLEHHFQQLNDDLKYIVNVHIN